MSEINKSDSDDQKKKKVLPVFQENWQLTQGRWWLKRSPFFPGKIGSTAPGDGPTFFSEQGPT